MSEWKTAKHSHRGLQGCQSASPAHLLIESRGAPPLRTQAAPAAARGRLSALPQVQTWVALQSAGVGQRSLRVT
jgi:hypothetical protein